MLTSRNILIIISMIIGLVGCPEYKSPENASIQQEEPASILPESQSTAQEQDLPASKPAPAAVQEKAMAEDRLKAETAPQFESPVSASTEASPQEFQPQTTTTTSSSLSSGHAPNDVCLPKKAFPVNLFIGLD